MAKKNIARGFGLFSLLITLAVVGLFIWLTLNSLQKSIQPAGLKAGETILAPIQAAKDVKNLIESRSNTIAP